MKLKYFYYKGKFYANCHQLALEYKISDKTLRKRLERNLGGYLFNAINQETLNKIQSGKKGKEKSPWKKQKKPPTPKGPKS